MSSITGINWFDINLESDYERNLNFLEGYSFDTLLLEIHCNLRKDEINEKKIKRHLAKQLTLNLDEAREIVLANLDNIISKALKDKEE